MAVVPSIRGSQSMQSRILRNAASGADIRVEFGSCGVVIVGSLSARPPFGATLPCVPGVPVLVEAMVSLQQPDSTPHQGVGGGFGAVIGRMVGQDYHLLRQGMHTLA